MTKRIHTRPSTSTKPYNPHIRLAVLVHLYVSNARLRFFPFFFSFVWSFVNQYPQTMRRRDPSYASRRIIIVISDKRKNQGRRDEEVKRVPDKVIYKYIISNCLQVMYLSFVVIVICCPRSSMGVEGTYPSPLCPSVRPLRRCYRYLPCVSSLMLKKKHVY